MNTIPVFDTRPAGLSLAHALRQRGFDAHSTPLLGFAAMPDLSALALAAEQLQQGRFQAVLYVSRTAIEYFWQAADPQRCPESLTHWCLGPGSRSALVQCFTQSGRSVPQIVLPDGPPWDSERLWQRIAPDLRRYATATSAAMQVLHVRGADAQGQGQGREWFGDQLLDHAVQVHPVLAYRRLLLPRAAQAGIWLISSSLSLAALPPQAPEWRRSVAVCVHARIAAKAAQHGFAQTLVANAELEATQQAVGHAQEWLKSHHG